MKPITIEESSGNVFADLGLPNPEMALLKAKLVSQLRAALDERKLTPAKSAELLGLDQTKLSALLRGRVEGYTLDRLVRLLAVAGRPVEIVVRPARRDRSPAAPS